MDTTLLFLGEIQRQCNFALIAYEEMKASLNNMKPGDSKELNHFWCSVQSFLVSVANISKIIWPSAPCGSALSPETNARSAKLASLLYSEEIKILKKRGFR